MQSTKEAQSCSWIWAPTDILLADSMLCKSEQDGTAWSRRHGRGWIPAAPGGGRHGGSHSFHLLSSKSLHSQISPPRRLVVPWLSACGNNTVALKMIVSLTVRTAGALPSEFFRWVSTNNPVYIFSWPLAWPGLSFSQPDVAKDVPARAWGTS